MIQPFREQPRLRVATLEAGRRADVEAFEIDGAQPLDLSPPALALEERGEAQELPPRMPEQAGAKLFAATVSDAIVAVAPGHLRSYLLTGRGELVADSVDDSPNVWRRAESDWRALAELGATPTTNPREVFLLGGQRGGYWHWWIDILPRVWLLDETVNRVVPGMRGQPPDGGALPLAIPAPSAEFQRESLDLLGLTERLELLEPGLTRFASVTFTRGLSGGGSRYPSRKLGEYARWLRERLAPDTGAEPGGRRLFISRASAASRRVVNEAELAPVLAEHGFEVVDPAGMSIAEQVALFSRASAVVGPHGAGLTNLLFSPPGTQVVELFAAPAAQGVSNYRVLASHLGMLYSRLLAAPVANEGGRGPHSLDMELDPRLLARALSAIA
ncbi:MAG: glycosyltransferase family 61 protein [Actinomycetota bacterium]|nr:glycosyltransferase family 61 protein [Actinomycetota bacterium]